jgi:hypothetical protein
MRARHKSTGGNILRWGVRPAIAAGLVLIAAACGSSGSSSSQEPSADAQQAARVQYANCMRSHGVSNFPEPNSQGQPQTGGPINLSSPQFLAAQKACAKYGGGGGIGTAPSVSPQLMQMLLKYVACMRTHGVPDMPDPSSNGALSLPVHGNVNPSSPQFQAAQQACQKLMPIPGAAS